jgi:hypothetical protein
MTIFSWITKPLRDIAALQTQHDRIARLALDLQTQCNDRDDYIKQLKARIDHIEGVIRTHTF